MWVNLSSLVFRLSSLVVPPCSFVSYNCPRFSPLVSHNKTNPPVHGPGPMNRHPTTYTPHHHHSYLREKEGDSAILFPTCVGKQAPASHSSNKNVRAFRFECDTRRDETLFFQLSSFFCVSSLGLLRL